MKKILAVLFLSLVFSARPALALFEDQEKQTLKTENANLKSELNTVKTDRDNLLKQTKTFLADKEALEAKLKSVEGAGAQSTAELDSLKNEIEILKSESAEAKNAREKDKELYAQEMAAREKTIAELNAKTDSLAHMMNDYPPARIQELLEDRNRLGEENKKMATRVLDMEKRLEEYKREVKPLELDREEMHRLRSENKELNKRIEYVSDLEKRQAQLLKENAEYREKLEVMKAKFKDAVPGLAKSGRISQKMMRENADMHYNLGTIFLNNKQYKEAINEYERVLELRPADPDTHYNLGVLYDDYLKDREKALYHYQKYLAINPRSPDAKKVESYVLSLELEQKVR
jgi:tetratricopeptide (TPR) repeat protein